MRVRYYADPDSLYIDLSSEPSADSREVATGVVLDFSAAGRIVGIDIDHASKLIDLSRLEAEGLPLSALTVGAK